MLDRSREAKASKYFSRDPAGTICALSASSTEEWSQSDFTTATILNDFKNTSLRFP